MANPYALVEKYVSAAEDELPSSRPSLKLVPKPLSYRRLRGRARKEAADRREKLEETIQLSLQDIEAGMHEKDIASRLRQNLAAMSDTQDPHEFWQQMNPLIRSLRNGRQCDPGKVELIWSTIAGMATGQHAHVILARSYFWKNLQECLHLDVHPNVRKGTLDGLYRIYGVIANEIVQEHLETPVIHPNKRITVGDIRSIVWNVSVHDTVSEVRDHAADLLIVMKKDWRKRLNYGRRRKPHRVALSGETRQRKMPALV